MIGYVELEEFEECGIELLADNQSSCSRKSPFYFSKDLKFVRFVIQIGIPNFFVNIKWNILSNILFVGAWFVIFYSNMWRMEKRSVNQLNALMFLVELEYRDFSGKNNWQKL